MPAFSTRFASACDVDLLASLHKDAWFHGFRAGLRDDVAARAIEVRCTSERWERFVESTVGGQEAVLIGMEEDDNPGGFIQFGFNSEGEAEVIRMYVIPSYWGSGMAHVLMDAAKQWFREHEAEMLTVWAADTPQAERFYEKCGFRSANIRREILLLDDIATYESRYELTL